MVTVLRFPIERIKPMQKLRRSAIVIDLPVVQIEWSVPGLFPWIVAARLAFLMATGQWFMDGVETEISYWGT